MELLMIFSEDYTMIEDGHWIYKGQQGEEHFRKSFIDFHYQQQENRDMANFKCRAEVLCKLSLFNKAFEDAYCRVGRDDYKFSEPSNKWAM